MAFVLALISGAGFALIGMFLMDSVLGYWGAMPSERGRIAGWMMLWAVCTGMAGVNTVYWLGCALLAVGAS